MSKKVDIFVEEKWEMTAALDRESVDLIYTFIDLLQYKEVEGLDIDNIIDDIKIAHEQNS